MSIANSEAAVTADRDSKRATARDYIALARVDHWTKHVFILPGIVLAFALRDVQTTHLLFNIIIGFSSAAAIASANYVINEWLDRPFDAFHPKKSRRAAVAKDLSPRIVMLQYLALVVVGLALAQLVSTLFLIASVAFFLSGIIYNVQPLRSKDRIYVDVLSEAINNPIRLFLGWSMVDPFTTPPTSLIIAYWMGGAFLMAAKRLSEYRDFSRADGMELLKFYRRSFKFYTEERLLISAFSYALLSMLFTGVFLIKYRAEYIIAMPFVCALFAVYLWRALGHDSIAQRPEHLFSEKPLMAIVGVTAVILTALSFVDLPFLEWISVPHFVGLKSMSVTGASQ
jgi:4-hydroxybenzoate polyprenyltransferase